MVACAFRLADIDSDMDAYLAGCRSGGEHSESDFVWEILTSSSFLQREQLLVILELLLVLMWKRQIRFHPMLKDLDSIWSILEESLITASLAIVVDGVSLLYVAHSGVIGVVGFNRKSYYLHPLNQDAFSEVSSGDDKY